MNERGKSDGPVVPRKPSNERAGRPEPEETVEGRGPAKENLDQPPRHRAQHRTEPKQALARIREAARADKGRVFTSLWHHVYDPARLREAYEATSRTAAPGLDGVTWQDYGLHLDANLTDLSERLRRGAFRAKAVKRAWIPKPDGRQRPIGIPVLEDKVVQRSMAEVLGAIYETEFKGFSYGFRPGRNPHMALDALTVGIETKPVRWILDADIKGFFDAIDHDLLLKIVETRICDPHVLRQLRKWLHAGVMSNGAIEYAAQGTPQGGSISPLLANIYLHHVLDVWADSWRKDARGAVIIVRYADDFVVGFQHKEDAERFLHDLRERFAAYRLELHPEKTRLIEFGRYARDNRRRDGKARPEVFNFLGFTHICSVTRLGSFKILRQTQRERMKRSLTRVVTELKRRRHWPLAAMGSWLGQVLRGHLQYYAVPSNGPALMGYRNAILRAWHRTLRSRSGRDRTSWRDIWRYVQRWLPPIRIQHPYPAARFARQHPRQEPGAVVLHAGIRAGGPG
jgi:RNA-directed DNA polymerase